MPDLMLGRNENAVRPNFDRIRGDCLITVALAVREAVLPTVPRTNQETVFDCALGERPAGVRAAIVEGGEALAVARERDDLSGGDDRLHGAALNFPRIGGLAPRRPNWFS